MHTASKKHYSVFQCTCSIHGLSEPDSSFSYVTWPKIAPRPQPWPPITKTFDMTRRINLEMFSRLCLGPSGLASWSWHVPVAVVGFAQGELGNRHWTTFSERRFLSQAVVNIWLHNYDTNCGCCSLEWTCKATLKENAMSIANAKNH